MKTILLWVAMTALCYGAYVPVCNTTCYQIGNQINCTQTAVPGPDVPQT
jgi:hypothetical protein